MTTWTVQDRATGQVVHAYSSEQSVDWTEFPFAECAGTVQTPAADAGQCSRALQLTQEAWPQ